LCFLISQSTNQRIQTVRPFFQCWKRTKDLYCKSFWYIFLCKRYFNCFFKALLFFFLNFMEYWFCFSLLAVEISSLQIRMILQLNKIIVVLVYWKFSAAMLEYLFATHLDILNCGDEPTFVNRVRTQIIDNSLASSNIWHEVQISLSDHRNSRSTNWVF
jgi:hypothetical protein